MAVIRVGVIGKTGSGKTTLSALLSLAWAARGRRVLAVDTDPSPNLGLSLGLDLHAAEAVAVVPRALARGRGGGSVTPAEVVANFGVATPAGVTLLHAMQANDEPAGCACPAHASARSLVASALDEECDVAVLDVEAGLDHLERDVGTVAHGGLTVVVVEPSHKSRVTAARMVAGARARGVHRMVVAGNKVVADRGDADFLADCAAELGLPLAGAVPHHEGVVEADRAGTGLAGPAADLAAALGPLLDALESAAG